MICVSLLLRYVRCWKNIMRCSVLLLHRAHQPTPRQRYVFAHCSPAAAHIKGAHKEISSVYIGCPEFNSIHPLFTPQLCILAVNERMEQKCNCSTTMVHSCCCEYGHKILWCDVDCTTTEPTKHGTQQISTLLCCRLHL